MNFQDLHEALRVELTRRIEQGALTGTRLALQTGFRQAHISNFLNRRRALSLEGLDRVMAAQELSVDQLMPVVIAAAEAVDLPRETRVQGDIVPVVTLSAATDETQILPANVIETAYVSASGLFENRSRISRRQAGWQRFVAVRPNAQETAAMHPVLAAGTLAVIDRHYNSIAPYRPGHQTLLAMRYGSSLLLRFVELDAGRLILRPSSTECPLHIVTVGPDETASDYVVGRVCLLIQEI